MNSKKFGSRVKGFTLIELIIVIAIIGILSGMISMLVTGFQRDARIESNNNKAQLIYTAFQNILINCEIQQDDEVFDIGRYNSPVIDKDIKYVQVYFEMDQAKLSDNVMLAVRYDGATTCNMPAKNVTTDDTYKAYQVIEEAITSYLDNTFEGFGIVYIDYENYVVDSVIYYEPGTFEGDITNYTAGIMPETGKLDSYADHYTYSGSSYSFRMLNSLADQKEYYKYVGTNIGAYPVYESSYLDSAGDPLDGAPTKVP